MRSRDNNSGNCNPLNKETYFFVPPLVTSGETTCCFIACCRKGQWLRGLLLHNKRIPRSNPESSQQWFRCWLELSYWFLKNHQKMVPLSVWTFKFPSWEPSNNGSIAGWNLKEMWLWHPELSEIDTWFEAKTKEFVEGENWNPNHDSEAWL